MTPNEAPATGDPWGPAPPAPTLNDNIRAELARTSTSVTFATGCIGDRGMSESTWQRRMRDPNTWTYGELIDLARALRTSVRVLVP